MCSETIAFRWYILFILWRTQGHRSEGKRDTSYCENWLHLANWNKTKNNILDLFTCSSKSWELLQTVTLSVSRKLQHLGFPAYNKQTRFIKGIVLKKVWESLYHPLLKVCKRELTVDQQGHRIPKQTRGITTICRELCLEVHVSHQNNGDQMLFICCWLTYAYLPTLLPWAQSHSYGSSCNLGLRTDFPCLAEEFGIFHSLLKEFSKYVDLQRKKRPCNWQYIYFL